MGTPSFPKSREGTAIQRRKRDRVKTLQDLEDALDRLRRGGQRVTLSAVAKEAAVTPPLIHNRYPDFAEKVRLVLHKGTRAQRDEKHSLLQKEREKNRELRALVTKLLKESADLASINEALRVKITLLNAVAEGKVISGRFGHQTEE